MSVYAISDLHGSLRLFEEIQRFLNKDDTLYVLGDCGDRGKEPWKTIKEVAKDPRCIYLKGNHEDILVQAIKSYKKYEDFYGPEMTTLLSNGGLNTLQEWSYEEQKHGWTSYLDKLPLYEKYVNKDGIIIHLSHAGFTPFTSIKEIEIIDLLWDRNHIFDIFPKDKSNEIVVHGHTPIPFIIKDFRDYGIEFEEYENGAFWYCDNHKVCIDTGAYYTNEIVMLDLDTFDEHIFQI